ncbi:MAG: hypothetical protein U1D30_19580 [Planctomycetota bacterium]
MRKMLGYDFRGEAEPPTLRKNGRTPSGFPLFVEEIKRRLMGDRLGSPIFTKEQFDYHEKLKPAWPSKPS